MAILGGLFSSKKDKQKHANGRTFGSATSELDHESLAGTEYNPNPPQSQHPPSSVYHNPPASSSKIMLPFRKKKSLTSPAPQTPPSQFVNYPTTRSEAAVDLIRPPPSKASIFGSYEADGADSTCSLPSVSHAKSESHGITQTAIAPPQMAKKSGGLFAWTRERRKSHSLMPPLRAEPDSSLDLKALRQLPAGSQVDFLQSTTSFTDPPGRPRGDSIASEASQRISVAAFREMQARRSTADSPTPSVSPRPTPITDNFARSDSPGQRASAMVNPSTNTSQISLQQGRGSRVTSAPRRYTIMTSTSSDTSSEEEESSDEVPHKIIQKKSVKSKSEMGHGSSSWNSPTVKKRRQIPTQDSSGFVRPRASVSASMSSPSPNPAAKQAAASNRPPQKSRKKDSDSSESGSDNSSEDDAPLASFVGPRRPGSAMSTSTNRTLPSKPLIDINTLVTPSSTPPSVRSAPQPPPKDASSSTNVNNRLANLAQEIRSKSPLGRSPGNDGSEVRPKPRETRRSMTALPTVSTNFSINPTQTSPRARTAVSPDHRPSVSIDTLSTTRGEIATSPGNASATTRVTSSISSSSFEKIDYPRPKRVSLCLDDTSAPIVPKPVLHRPPPSGFRVTSRPEHPRLSSSPTSPTAPETSSSVSPTAKSEPYVSPQTSHEEKRSSTFDFAQSAFSGFDLEDKLATDSDKPSIPVTTKARSLSPTSDTSSKASSPTVRIVDPSSDLPRQPSPYTVPPVSPSVSASSSYAQPSPRKKPSPSSTLISQIPPHQPYYAVKKSTPAPSAKPTAISVASSPVSTSSARSSFLSPMPAPIAKPTAISVASSSVSTSSARSSVVSPIPVSAVKPTAISVASSSVSTSSTRSSFVPPMPVSGAKPTPISVATSSSSNRSSFVPSMPASRQKAQTLISMVSDSPTNSFSSSSMVPPRPFASRSPASSTGGSSSGRGVPVTPRDGSDIGSEIGPGRRPGARTGAGAGISAAGREAKQTPSAPNAKKAGHWKSVSYDERVGDGINSFVDDEARIRDRRRSEAKNAIELGNVMHKPIRLDDDDEEQMNSNMGINPMMNMYNPMLGMGMGMGGMPPSNLPMQMAGPPNQWLPPPQMPGGPMMQQFMMPPPPPNVDPHFLAAHQQAMMVAKQAYQYSVAQQAMAVAGEEWERGSSASFFGGGAGGWGGSTAGSVIFNPAPRTMYAGSVYGGSEIGGPAGWGSSSAYGGAFGPNGGGGGAGNRSSMLRGGPQPPRSELASHPAASYKQQLQQQQQQQQQQVRPSARSRTKTAPPESRTSGVPFPGTQETSRGRGRTPPPPSSWRRSEDQR